MVRRWCVAAGLGGRFSRPVGHLAKILWLPGWVNRSEVAFDILLCEELQKPAWVMDGNYRRTLAVRLAAAAAAVLPDIPAAVCLESAYARVREYAGRTRPDMGEGCPERVDAEFEGWILKYDREVRPAMLARLEESKKPVFVFSSREAARAWLESFSPAR